MKNLKLKILEVFVIKLIIFSSVIAFANPLSNIEAIKSEFAKILNKTKGPFGDNMLQGSKSKTSVKSGAHPSGTFYFQAAFRNDSAKKLAQFGFYTGNLFASNYYELTGEFVYQNPHGSFLLANESLISKGEPVIEKANLMVQNWVLEKYFARTYPSTKFAQSFVIRGISGSEFEQVFAQYFFNMYLSLFENDYQYLSAFILAKESPISDSPHLAKSRDMISSVCDYFNCSHSNHKDLWNIRNAIHNQLSEKVITMIGDYLLKNPWYEKEGHTYLQIIKSMLTEYYSFSAKDLIQFASKAKAEDVKIQAENIAANGVTEENLYLLSKSLVDLKISINSAAVNNKVDVFVLLLKGSQYLNAQINKLNLMNSNQGLLALLNNVFIEGFLVQDNWDYYREQIESVDFKNGVKLLPEIVEIATDTFNESFVTAYPAWKAIAPDVKLENFVDDHLKSSALNNASLLMKLNN